MLALKPQMVPADLTQPEQWVLWKTCQRGGKPTKLPFQASGQTAKSNDPRTWSGYRDVVSRYQNGGGYDGVGFMFSEADEFCGVDLDGCRNAQTGQVADWARQIVMAFDSYSEVSPSGTGIKIFFRGTPPFSTGRKCLVEGVEHVCDKEPGIELYNRLRYFAVTGWRLKGVDPGVQARQDQLECFCGLHFPQEEKQGSTHGHGSPLFSPQYGPDQATVIDRARKYVLQMPVAVSGLRGHDRAFHAACVLCLGFGLSPDEAYPVYHEWNSGCNPPWSDKELRHKLEDAANQPGDRNYLRDVQMRDWKHIPVPVYKQPAPLPERTTLKSAAEKYLSQIRESDRKLVSVGLGDIDYAIGGGVEYGEMIAVGGRPGHGKSMAGLQIVASATEQGICSLFISEEMSALALGKRTIQYATPVAEESWHYRIELVEQDVARHFKQRAPCYAVESVGTVERACELVRKVVAEDDVQFVVIDYAQLLKGSGKTRYEQVTDASIQLRQLANQTGIILVVLCQLNRNIESRPKFIPKLGDLRESGQIEQDCDVLLFLLWPHRLDSRKDPHEFYFFVAKNRNRPINSPTVKAQFLPSRQMVLEEPPAGRLPGDEPEEDAVSQQSFFGESDDAPF